MDLTLPDGSGIALAEEWRASGARIRALALTGDSETATRRACEAAGFAGVLVKPVPTRVLLAATAALLAS